MDLLGLHIEALIFSGENPLTVKEIMMSLSNLIPSDMTEENVLTCIAEIQNKYDNENFAFHLAESGGGYQFLTKTEFYPTLMHFRSQVNSKRLSTAALETLAIIAYKQPVTKPEIEQIRGVNCDYSIQKLLEKELISIAGRSEGPGKPLQYAVSQQFLNHFGINHVSDLPKLKEVEPQEDNAIGIPESAQITASETQSEVHHSAE